MKLKVKNIGNKYAMLEVITKKHYCTVSTIENDTAIITKHEDLTKSEFGLVASDLVMEGFHVQLASEVAELEKNLTESKKTLQNIFSDLIEEIAIMEFKLKQLKANNA